MRTVTIQKEEMVYYAEGVLLLNLWGGGQGYYPAEKYKGEDLNKLKAEIKCDFKSGALDSGMGCESIEGAIIHIDCETTLHTGGRIYKSEVCHDHIKLGNIDEKEAEEMYFAYQLKGRK